MKTNIKVTATGGNKARKKRAINKITLRINKIGTISRDLSFPMKDKLVTNIFHELASLSQKLTFLPMPKCSLSAIFYLIVISHYLSTITPLPFYSDTIFLLIFSFVGLKNCFTSIFLFNSYLYIRLPISRYCQINVRFI